MSPAFLQANISKERWCTNKGVYKGVGEPKLPTSIIF
mgnify:CR=1 FL=1